VNGLIFKPLNVDACPLWWWMSSDETLFGEEPGSSSDNGKLFYYSNFNSLFNNILGIITANFPGDIDKSLMSLLESAFVLLQNL